MGTDLGRPYLRAHLGRILMQEEGLAPSVAPPPAVEPDIVEVYSFNAALMVVLIILWSSFGHQIARRCRLTRHSFNISIMNMSERSFLVKDKGLTQGSSSPVLITYVDKLRSQKKAFLHALLGKVPKVDPEALYQLVQSRPPVCMFGSNCIRRCYKKYLTCTRELQVRCQ